MSICWSDDKGDIMDMVRYFALYQVINDLAYYCQCGATASCLSLTWNVTLFTVEAIRNSFTSFPILRGGCLWKRVWRYQRVMSLHSQPSDACFRGRGLYPIVENLSPISTIRRSLGKILYIARYVHTFCWWFFILNHVRYWNG
jgi:hypothetical protein